MKTFFQLVRSERLAKGLTLSKVARAIRSHKGYISGIENAKVNPPSTKFVLRYAKVLGLDAQDLLALAVIAKLPRALELNSLRSVLDRMIQDIEKATEGSTPTLSAVTTQSGEIRSI
jgi:transcriptional regulator with XRE-family HTH domain